MLKPQVDFSLAECFQFQKIPVVDKTINACQAFFKYYYFIKRRRKKIKLAAILHLPDRDMSMT